MEKDKRSTAQRRAERRRVQGKVTGEFDFDFATEVQSIDDYFNVFLTEEKIVKLRNEYIDINDKVYVDFKEKTSLEAKDITFLFLAIGLQCARQYLLTSFRERVDHEYTKKDDKKIEDNIKNVLKNGENETNKQGGYYYRSLERIFSDGVPYDTIAGGKGLGLSGQNHRYKTLGHDPILGWIFGPLNIMTGTLTTYTFQSYHIRNMTQINGVQKPSIYSRAENGKIIEASFERIKNEPVALAASIAKQAIHYNSDVNTKKSLPVPFVQIISPEIAKQLADYGIDMANIATVGKQATYSILINTIIAIVHRMFFDSTHDGDEKLYEVRTRKILLYSNAISSASNALYVAFSGDIAKLDIGGMLVTIYRIVTDEKFIRQVMKEFVDSQVSEAYQKELDRTNIEYKRLLLELGY
ncbi:MAG: hypothetical protein ACRDDX_05555 [Cellulosilyticaceae bacterium]